MVAVLPVIADVQAIIALIDHYSQVGIVIRRSRQEIIENIHNFRVIKEGNRVLGCVSLHLYSSDLAELRTLVVDSRCHGQGVGSLLVETMKLWAHELKVTKLFTLTVEVGFFQKHGFQVIDRYLLPEKIFKDCHHCRFLNDCQETALWIILNA